MSLFGRVCFVSLFVGVLWAPASPAEGKRDETVHHLQERIAELERMIRQLRAELVALKRQFGMGPSMSLGVIADGSLKRVQIAGQKGEEGPDQELRELEEALRREIGKELQEAPSLPSTRPPIVYGGGMWQVLNPDISAIADFRLGFSGRRPFSRFAGSEFAEMELALQAYSDPFARLDAFVAITPHGTEIEEATLSVLDIRFLRPLLPLPRNLQLQLGLLRAPFGELNMIHPPEQPFADSPLVHRLFFGEREGESQSRQGGNAFEMPPARGDFVGAGLALRWMFPVGDDVAWLTIAPMNPSNPTFSASRGGPVWVARLRWLKDLGVTRRLHLGFSFASGRNEGGRTTRLLGLDITYRWRPVRRGLYRSFVWNTEFYWMYRDTPSGRVHPKGFFSQIEYQISRTLFFGARYDFAQSVDKSFSGQGLSLNFTLAPSEFARYRLQWNWLKLGGQRFHEIWVQTTLRIGPHWEPL